LLPEISAASSGGDESLEPSFKRLLRFHWMEEPQHARLDGLLVWSSISSRSRRRSVALPTHPPKTENDRSHDDQQP
jgi:hypothetical protein